MRTRLGFAAFTLALALGGAAAAGTHPAGDTRSGVGDSADVGYLTLSCDPPASVSIDGEAKGTTPIVKLPLAAGAHQLTLASADGKLRRTLGVKIVKGETTRLRVSLGP
jgi:hypothetical protein